MVSEQGSIKNAFTQGRLFFASLAYASEVTGSGRPFRIADDAVTVVIAGATCYIPLRNTDGPRIERLEKEEKKLR